MGYILPLNHEQYRHYANQVSKKDEPPFIIDPVYKASLDHKLKEQKQFEEHDEEKKRQYQYKKSSQRHLNRVGQDVIDYYIADLTGKGQNFNEQI